MCFGVSAAPSVTTSNAETAETAEHAEISLLITFRSMPSSDPSGLVSCFFCLLRRSGPLRVHIPRLNRLARRHEQPVPLRAAERQVRTHLGQPDAADQPALRRPHRHAVVADGAPRVARAPEVPVDVAP